MQFLFSKLKTLHQFWLDQWPDEKEVRENDFRSFLIRLGSILFLYVFLDRLLMRVSRIPLESFQEPFIYFAFLKNFVTDRYVIFLVPLILFLFFFRRNLLASWADFPKGRPIRFFIVLTTAILVWSFSTYDYNFFYNQGHYIDRFLLVLFLILIYWRPVFVLPFLTILIPMIWQFTLLEGFTWTTPVLLIRLLILFYSFFLIYLITRKLNATDFVFLTCCFLAAGYWVSGFGKLSWQWLRYDQISLLLPATYANGWLGFLKPETMIWLTQIFTAVNVPLKIFTLIVECGVLLFFWNRYSMRFFLVGWMLFHVGILMVSGIFFWMWILIATCLLWLFVWKSGFAELRIWGWKYLLVSMVLILSSPFWLRPVALAWFDVPATYTYRFEAITEDEQKFLLPPKFFAPYDHQFTLSTFSYLDNKKPIIPITWGIGPAEVMNIRTADEILAYEKSKGKIAFNEKKTELFDVFVKRYIQNWNNDPSKGIWLGYIAPPRLDLS